MAFTSKVDGGQGGKLGHSNMSHWDYTEVIKSRTKKLRRQADLAAIEEQLDDDEDLDLPTSL